MRNDFRRMAVFTSGLADLTRHRAEELVRTWTHGGDTPRDQVGAMARELVEWSRQNRKELMRFVRSEIESQLASMGVATAHDLEQLERKITRLEAQVARAARSGRTSGARKTTARKKATRKKTASKTTRRRASL